MDPLEVAKERVKEKKKFYKEIVSFITTSLTLLFINVFFSPGFMWSFIPIGFWGLALVIKGIKIGVGSQSYDWEKKQLRKELQQMGEDPDDYLELEDDDYFDIEKRPIKQSKGGYKKSDLV